MNSSQMDTRKPKKTEKKILQVFSIEELLD